MNWFALILAVVIAYMIGLARGYKKGRAPHGVPRMPDPPPPPAKKTRWQQRMEQLQREQEARRRVAPK